MIRWYEAKHFLHQSTAISMDALHVFVGVILFLLIALLLRRPLTDRLVLLAVLALALLNEAIDIWVERWPSIGMQLGEAAKDVALTVLLPALIAGALRLWPSLVATGRRASRRR